MQRRTVLRTAGLAAGAGLGALAGCGSDQDESTPAVVEMVTDGGEFYNDPLGLFVDEGTTVTWENVSGRHSTTAYVSGTATAETTRVPDGAEGWDSGVITGVGERFEHTFETAGTYDYFCRPHKSIGMVGRVVVGELGGPAEDRPIPDGEVPDSATIVEEGAVGYEAFTG